MVVPLGYSDANKVVIISHFQPLLLKNDICWQYGCLHWCINTLSIDYIMYLTRICSINIPTLYYFTLQIMWLAVRHREYRDNIMNNIKLKTNLNIKYCSSTKLQSYICTMLKQCSTCLRYTNLRIQLFFSSTNSHRWTYTIAISYKYAII